MNKRLFALSLTGAIVMAACVTPTAPAVVGAPTIVSVTPGPSVVAGNSGTVTVVTTAGTNGGVISSVKAGTTTCTMTSANNYTCSVPVPAGTPAGNFPVTVTVTNNAVSPNNTASSTTGLNVTAPVVTIGAPTISGSVTGSVQQGAVASVAYTATAGSNGAIQQITASIGGNTTVCGTSLTGTCSVTIPSGTPVGNATIVLTVTNNGAAGSNSATVNVPVTVTAAVVTPPPVAGPVIDDILVAPITLDTGATGTASVLVDADAQGGASLKTIKISYNGVVVADVTLPAGTTGVNQFYTFPISGTDVDGPVSIEVTDTNNRTATASRVLDITRNVIPTPPTAIFGTLPTAGTGIRTDDIDDNNQYRARFLDQVDPSNAAQTTTRLYIRGTFPVATLPTLVGTRGGAGLTSTTWAAGASIEYFLSNTTTDAGNKIGANLNTVGLNNGQIYYIYARRSGPGGDGSSAGVFTFVPDNLEPQVPDISEVSDIPNLRSQLGNWVTFNPTAGKLRPFPATGTATGRTLELRLDNARSLEDLPQNASGGNPGAAVRGTGIREVRYFAQPVLPTYVGGPLTSNADLDAAILLGQTNNNGVGANNGQDNWKVDVSSIPQGLLKDGRYVVVAVAYDYLGNRNLLGGQNSFILNVDSTAPEGTLGVVDRGPLDVNASFVNTGANPLACQRVNLAASSELAPSDVYTAESGYVSGCAVVRGTATDPLVNGVAVGFGTNPLSILSSGTALSITADPLTLTSTLGSRTATRTPVVVNLNQVSGEIVFNTLPEDILGNKPAARVEARIIVDNEEPIQLNLNLASTNSSNVFNAWQQVGLQGTAFDSISGLRTDPSKQFMYFYGTDEDVTAGNGRYNRALIQIDESNVTNFNIPSPTDSRGPLERQKLNVWLMAVDKAGNANAKNTVLTVREVSTNRPTVRADVQSRDAATPSTPALPTLGAIETGLSFPAQPYRGLTALNRSITGVVPARTEDQLPVGPTRVNAGFADPAQPIAGSVLATDNDYSFLPTPGSNNTNVYELIVPEADITFRGDVAFTQGAGAVDFIYRVADPLLRAPRGTASSADAVIEINPVDLPNSVSAPASNRYLYNLPAFSARLEEVRQIGHIWQALPSQSVENGVFKAVIDPSGLEVFDRTRNIGHTGVGVLVYNNYGNVDIQTKGFQQTLRQE